jgi:sialidase-1
VDTYYAFPLKIILPADEVNVRRGEASMIITGGGTMIVYSNHSGRDDNDTGDIYAQRLDQEANPCGKEWKIIERQPGSFNVMSPAIRWLANGKIGMVYSNRISATDAQRMFVSSADEGKTWSGPVTVDSGGYVTGCHDRFTVLSSGRLIAPLHFSRDLAWPYRKIKTAYSDDNGASWKLSNTLALPWVGQKYDWEGESDESGCNEPGVAERADGSLLMCIRTSMGTVFYSESFDSGVTWTSPISLGLVSPRAPAHVSRIPGSDDLLIFWTSGYDAKRWLYGERHTIMSAISHDGGKSWPYEERKIIVHDEEHSVDYPTVCYHEKEVWVAFRHSTQRGILEGRTSTGLMPIPLDWLRKR